MNKKIENLEVKYKEKIIDANVAEKIEEIYNIETRYAILMAIITFGSSNIKRLGRLLGKNDATILYHIKELTKKPEFLQIDEEMTNTHRGIYYKLTELANKHFSEPQPEKIADAFSQLYDVISTKTDQEIVKFYFDLMAKNPDLGNSAIKDQRRLTYYHILENFMMNNLENAEESVKKGFKPINKKYPFGTISISAIDFKITTPRHLFEILKVQSEMMSKLSKLQEKFTQEMNDKLIPDSEKITIHYHLIGGEISEFEFEEVSK